MVLLEDYAQTAQCFGGVAFEVEAGNFYCPLASVIKPGDEGKKAGFSRAIRT